MQLPDDCLVCLGIYNSRICQSFSFDGNLLLDRHDLGGFERIDVFKTNFISLFLEYDLFSDDRHHAFLLIDIFDSSSSDYINTGEPWIFDVHS